MGPKQRPAAGCETDALPHSLIPAWWTLPSWCRSANSFSSWRWRCWTRVSRGNHSSSGGWGCWRWCYRSAYTPWMTFWRMATCWPCAGPWTDPASAGTRSIWINGWVSSAGNAWIAENKGRLCELCVSWSFQAFSRSRVLWGVRIERKRKDS